ALVRATALVSARPNPLKPANEIVAAVGLELAAILTRAMAQNPDERYANAAEFRQALRQIGRVGEKDVEYSVHHSQIDSNVAAIEETVLTSSTRVSATGRLGSNALAALFVILLAAFGVFCSYYPWKMPAAAPQRVVLTDAAALPSVERARVD